MSSAIGLFLLVTLIAAPSVHGFFWDMLDWSTEEPENCPHESPETHICSTLGELNATCVTFKCCNEFYYDDDYSEYNGETMPEEDGYYYIGQPYDGCSMCFSIKECSVYKCFSRCCDGFEPDQFGRCQNKTGHLQCMNGGTPLYDFCICREGFEGKSCEIPKCYCENGGECLVKDGKPFCNCSYGHYGEKCEMSRCTISCQNGGECFRNGSYEACRCPHNYIGKHCETYFTQPTSCPAPNTWHSYCSQRCSSNTDCSGGKVCCREGCTTVCREPKAEFCEYEGRRFRIGQNFKPKPCLNCTCLSNGRVHCTYMECGPVTCRDGSRPVTKPGTCCPTCPEKPTSEGPVMLGCPDGVVYVNTSYGADYALLDTTVVPIHAHDPTNYRRLEIEFSPRIVKHCSCHDNRYRPTEVRAFARDSDGRMAVCYFQVVVQDNQPPVFKSCPEDIYRFDDEVVTWQKPRYCDNVKVVRMSCTDKRNGKYFPVGQHALTYQIWDYDGNSAFCNFRVSVTERGTDFNDLPQGLRNRSKDKKIGSLMVIIGPIIGVLVVVALALLLFLCCRRHKAAAADRTAPPAYDNNIYSLPGDISGKPPIYDDLPMNPPPYSVTGKEKEVAYLAVAPPSYSNPGYETLKVHKAKSDSVKSAKSYTESEVEK